MGRVRCRVKTAYVIINFVLNRTEHPLSTCLRRATPSAYLDLCQTVVRAWSTRVKEEKDAIPQVIFNNKEFNQKLCDFSELYPGEQEWEAFPTVLLSPLHNLPGTMMMQIQTFLASTTVQQPGHSQRKWTQKEWTQPIYTTYYQMQHIWDPRAVFGSRKHLSGTISMLLRMHPASQSLHPSVWTSFKVKRKVDTVLVQVVNSSIRCPPHQALHVQGRL